MIRLGLVSDMTASNTDDSLVLHRKSAANSAYKNETSVVTAH